MHSETQQTIANLARWLNEVVARGEWQAESSTRGGRYGCRRDQNDVAVEMASAEKWVSGEPVLMRPEP
jgi:hypothetical protein